MLSNVSLPFKIKPSSTSMCTCTLKPLKSSPYNNNVHFILKPVKWDPLQLKCAFAPSNHSNQVLSQFKCAIAHSNHFSSNAYVWSQYTKMTLYNSNVPLHSQYSKIMFPLIHLEYTHMSFNTFKYTQLYKCTQPTQYIALLHQICIQTLKNSNKHFH